jgi:hypothetical protein
MTSFATCLHLVEFHLSSILRATLIFALCLLSERLAYGQNRAEGLMQYLPPVSSPLPRAPGGFGDQLPARRSSSTGCADAPNDGIPQHACGPAPQPCPEKHVYLHVPPERHEEYQQVPEAGPAAAPGPGYFAAPPRFGRAVESGRGVGLRGFAIHFPELSLRLPSIELPTIARYHSAARMELEAATAPFVPMRPAVTGMAAVPTARLARTESAARKTETAEPESSRCSSECTDDENYRKKIEDLRRLEAELRARKRELEIKLDYLNRCLERFPAAEELPAPHSRPMPRGNSQRVSSQRPASSGELVRTSDGSQYPVSLIDYAAPDPPPRRLPRTR